jgi:hypothetical protein
MGSRRAPKLIGEGEGFFQVYSEKLTSIDGRSQLILERQAKMEKTLHALSNSAREDLEHLRAVLSGQDGALKEALPGSEAAHLKDKIAALVQCVEELKALANPEPPKPPKIFHLKKFALEFVLEPVKIVAGIFLAGVVLSILKSCGPMVAHLANDGVGLLAHEKSALDSHQPAEPLASPTTTTKPPENKKD